MAVPASLLAAALSLPAVAGQAATVQPIPAGVTTVTLAQQAPIQRIIHAGLHEVVDLRPTGQRAIRGKTGDVCEYIAHLPVARAAGATADVWRQDDVVTLQ